MKRWYDCRSSRFIGQYSSRLNVITFLNERPSSLWSRTSSSYTPCGVEPVARPRTAGCPRLFFSRISSAISRATALLAAPEDG